MKKWEKLRIGNLYNTTELYVIKIYYDHVLCVLYWIFIRSWLFLYKGGTIRNCSKQKKREEIT